MSCCLNELILKFDQLESFVADPLLREPLSPDDHQAWSLLYSVIGVLVIGVSRNGAVFTKL